MVGIEPFWMKWTEREVHLEKLKHPMSVLFLSDTQMKGEHGFREKWILKQIKKRKWDLILTTGDLFDTPGGEQPAVDFLEQLSSHARTFAILGNWEHWSGANLKDYKKALTNKSVVLLVNENRELNWYGQQIFLLGVDDSSQSYHNIPLALKNVPHNALKVLLAHGPIIFPESSESEIDLMLAGHTHGGQVKLPFMDPFYLPPGCGPYFYGLYKKNLSTLLVTSGVGTSILPIRFGSRPEIVSLTLKPKNDSEAVKREMVK